MGTGVDTGLEMGLEMEMGPSTLQCILGNAFSLGSKVWGGLCPPMSLFHMWERFSVMAGNGQRPKSQKQTYIVFAQPLSALYKTPSENKKTTENTNAATFS